MRPSRLRALALSALVLAAACSDGTAPAPVATTIQLQPASLTLPDGQSERITATVLDQNGNPLSPLPAGTSVTWTSSDPAVATVTSGFVTANRPGTATIRAEAGSASATASVQVTQVAVSVERNAGDAQQAARGELLPDSLEVRVVDRHGTGVPNVTVTWQVASGGGVIVGATSTTGANGAARAAWRLGDQLGQQTVEVRAGGVGIGVLFTATAAAVGADEAPFITSISPATLTPGATATIDGGNFGSAVAALDVRVGGVAVEITEVTPQRLSVRLPARHALPCQPAGPAAVTVTFAGYTARHEHPLRVGITRSLATGQSLFLTGADQVSCNELPPGRYMLSTYNASRLGGAQSLVEIRGTVAGGAAAALAASPAAFAAPASSPAETRAAREHLRILEMNRELLRRLAPQRRAQPAVSRSVAAARTPAVGDTLQFRVPRLDAQGSICNAFDEVKARVVYVGEHAVMFEDTRAPVAGRMDSVYAGMGREYDRDMHDLLLENFGNPFALGSELVNTNQVYMLFTRTVNDNAPGTAAFVYAGDLFDRSLCNASNRAAMFYAMVPTDSSTSFQSNNGVSTWRWQMRSTVIHEVKHIISFVERLQRNGGLNNDLRFEDGWLEESTARISEELWARRVFGYSAADRVTFSQSIHCENRPSFAECTGYPLAMRKHFTGLYDYLVSGGSRSPLWTEDSSFYGSGWSLVRWAIAHSGRSEAAFLRELTQDHTRSGIENLEARAGKQWAEILPAWSLSMATSGIGGFSPGRADLLYPGWNVASIFQGLNSDFPSRYTRATPQFTALGAGAFTRPAVPVRGGAAPVFELNDSPQLRAVQLRGPENAPVGANVGVALVRLN